MLFRSLTNAAKFTQNGAVDLTISEFGDEHILFVVKDNGIGISGENLERIFDSFYQVESSLSRNYEGTGIGLAISSNFAELLGGQISVQSELGKGSVFSLTLPRVQSKRPHISKPQPSIN